MPNTRSKASEAAVPQAKVQKRNAREYLKQEIERKKKIGARVDVENLQKQLDEVDRMDIDDDPGPNANGDGASTSNSPAPEPSATTPQGSNTAGGSASTTNPPAPEPSATTPQGSNTAGGSASTTNPPAPEPSATTPQGSNTAGGSASTTNPPAPEPSATTPQGSRTRGGGSGSRREPERDETGELCVGLSTLTIHEGTPVAYRYLKGGDIGLIMRLGPIEACIYELQKVGKGYPIDGLMAKEELRKGSCKFKCVHGVMKYSGNLIDVKVRMLRPKEGSDGEVKSTVHWITRTNLNNFLPKELALSYIKDTWDWQEEAYAKINPNHMIQPFPQMRTRKSADKDGHEQRT